MGIAVIKNYLTRKNIFAKIITPKIKLVRRYYSVGTADFISTSPEVDNISYGSAQLSNASGVTKAMRAPVTLPDGAIIISAIVYGNDPVNDTFQLFGNHLTANTVDNLTAETAIGTEAPFSHNANKRTVDNSKYSYLLWINFDNTNIVYGGRITCDVPEITD